MQKVLVVGMLSTNPHQYTYATSFIRTFQKLNYKVQAFNNRHHYTFPMIEPIKTSINNYCINQSLKRVVRHFQPDIIFFIKAENIFASTLAYIKKNFKAQCINFYPDNPFTVWNGNSTIHVLKSLPYYDHFLIWSESLIPVLQAAGCKKVHYFPFAYDEELFKNHHAATPSKEYLSEVCFVGTWEKSREEWITGILSKLPHLTLAIWGNLWKENIQSNHPLYGCIRGNALYGNELLQAFQGADIILNFIREQNMSAHNMRTFEVPAARGFMLTQRTIEQAEKLFKENDSIVCFSTLDELVHKITWYLQQEDKRKKIIDHAYATVQQYTLYKQLAEFLSNNKKTLYE